MKRKLLDVALYAILPAALGAGISASQNAPVEAWQCYHYCNAWNSCESTPWWDARCTFVWYIGCYTDSCNV